ncbi:MAG: flavin reductase family protein [Pseudomonadota bacterium]
MFYEPAKDNHGLKYNPYKAIVAPRPIAWVSTRGGNGDNLGPYSFFNAMSDMPPMLGFNSGPAKLGIDEPKDSVTNIRETGEFVVNIVSADLMNAMNTSSFHFEHGIDEFEKAGLTKSEATMINAPMVADSPVNLECKLYDILDLPAPGNAHWIIGEVIGIHIKDEFIDGDFVRTGAWRPVSRLGYKEYAIVENVIALERPKNV